MSDLKQPSENFPGKVNIEDFWDSVQLEMISRGFFQSIYMLKVFSLLLKVIHLFIMQFSFINIFFGLSFSGRAKNIFAVNPSFEHWAPWIGKNTRKSEMVLNTEFEKVSSTFQKSSTEAEVSMVSEDRLVDELMKQKVYFSNGCICLDFIVRCYLISNLYFTRFQLCASYARPAIWIQRDHGQILL